MSNQAHSRWRSALRLALGLAVSALFAWLSLRKINLPEVGRALRQARVAYVLLGAVPFLAAWVLRGWRWKQLLPGSAISTPRLTLILWVGNLGNLIFPLRLGDLLRAVMVSRTATTGTREYRESGNEAVGNNRPPISLGQALASIVVEKLLDLLTILAYLVLALVLLPASFRPHWLRALGVTSGIVLGIGLVVTVLFAVFGPRATAWLEQRLQRRRSEGPDYEADPARTGSGEVSGPCDDPPEGGPDTSAAPPTARPRSPAPPLAGLFGKLVRFAEAFALGTRGRGRNLLAAGGLSVVIWALEACAYMAWAAALKLALPFLPALILLAVGNLSMLIPASPGAVGTYDYACSQAAGLLFRPAHALALALLIHVCMLALVALLGLGAGLVEWLRWGVQPFRVRNSEFRIQNSE
jgi:uncharacterized membrane protein YbhN (UPF0104 family)